MDEINILIEENEMLKQRIRDVEILTAHLMGNLPQSKVSYFLDSLVYGVDIVKNNMTLIVFLNGVTLFGYGLMEMFL